MPLVTRGHFTARMCGHDLPGRSELNALGEGARWRCGKCKRLFYLKYFYASADSDASLSWVADTMLGRLLGL